VGGEKVYPAEVENVIQELDSVAEATVYGEKNPIMGNIVCADIRPAIELNETRAKEFIAGVKQYCRQKLQKHKVPLRINIIDASQYTKRFKKDRG